MGGTRTDKSPYEAGLERNDANYVPLTPLSFLRRAAAVFPSRTAWIHGSRHASYAEFYARCRRLASALAKRGIGPGDTVAIMSPNTPAMLEAHYGVPMCGAVLNALNYRLDAASLGFILDHAKARVLLTDRSFSPVIADALARAEAAPLVIDIDDAPEEGGDLLGGIEYEALLAGGDPDYDWRWPEDEWEAISLNYTSGTTGNPKGVVYHHRGAYLNSLGDGATWAMPHGPVYLWTLPMFHCNGWCFTWAVSAYAGTHVCLRKVEAGAIFQAIAEHGVTHFCGAPIVLNLLSNASEEERVPFDHRVEVMTAAAPAARRCHRAHRGGRLPRYSRLRADRGLRPGHRVRLARRVGCAAAPGTGRAQGPPGRRLPHPRRAHGGRLQDARARAAGRRDHG